MTAKPAELARRELLRRAARTELARRSLADFARQSIAAGVVDGIQRVEWGPHLDAICEHTQLMLEGWLVAHGKGTREMLERQRAAWERTGATWEDSLPEPWLRYVLVQNSTMNVPPGTLKSTLVMVIANAWIWLWEPAFSFGAASGIESNVDRDSKATRDLVRSSWYRETFAIAWSDYDDEDPDLRVRTDSDAVSDWATTAGGKRKSRTISTGFTGTHVDCVTGDTLVATEIGDVAIEELVLMAPMPRVWSMNHATGRLELAEVRAWRRIDGRSTVDVHMGNGDVLRCTNDHRIYADGEYRRASECAGRAVSVVRRPGAAGEQRQAATLRCMQDAEVDVRDVFEGVHARRGRAGEARAERDQVRPVLLGEVHEDQSMGTGDYPGVPMRQDVQTARPEAEPQALLAPMRAGEPQAPLSGPAVRIVWSDHAGDIREETVLLRCLPQRGPLDGNARDGKLELQRSEQAVLRRAVGQPAAVDQGARWPRVRGVSVDGNHTRAVGTPHRRGPDEQRRREPRHPVRVVPHDAPQVVEAAVLFVAPTLAGDRRATHTVYDLEVGGNHNFFAGGVLVHNCTFLDDPDDADKVYGEADRVRPQNRFTRAIENRVNCEHRSLRLVLQQRVHVEDFTAYLLSILRWSSRTPKGWAQLCIAAEYGYGPDDAPTETPYGWRDWRTEKGELIHPRISAGVLADKRLKMPGYEGQYNQNPARQVNGMFERRHARFFAWEGTNLRSLRARMEGLPSRDHEPPVMVRREDVNRWTLSVDAANSLDPKPGAKVSAVGLIVGGCIDEQRLIVDDRTRVLGVAGTYLAIFGCIADYPLDRILVELKALGAGVMDELQRAIRRGWYVHPDTDERIELRGPDGKPPRCVVEAVNPGKEDKVQRAHAMLPAWQQGHILLLDDADWLRPKADSDRKTVDEGFIGEICSFPGSRRKDRADATSQLVAYHRGSQDTRQKWQAMSRLAMIGTRR